MYTQRPELKGGREPMKTIENQQLVNMRNKPLMLPTRDEDGELVPKNPDAPEGEQIAEMAKADTKLALETVVYALPRTIQAQADGTKAPQLLAAIDRAEDGKIEMHDKVYDWVHRVLNREVPIEKAEKDSGVHQLTYARRLFGLHADVVVAQLKDVDSTPEDIWQKDLDD